jgi:hypothetical protein
MLFSVMFSLLPIRRSHVVWASSRLASARAARAVITLGVARAAGTTAATGRAAVAVTGSVVLTLNHNFFVVAVIAVDEESEELCDDC